jgi:hypothetical protein
MMSLFEEWISTLQKGGEKAQLEEALQFLRSSISKERAHISATFHAYQASGRY